MEDDGAGVPDTSGATPSFEPRSGLGAGGTEYDDVSEDGSAFGSEDDGGSEGEDDGPDPAELIAKVDALGDGLGLAHAKLDALMRVVFGAMGVAVPAVRASAAK
jgi:hypothetical protein